MKRIFPVVFAAVSALLSACNYNPLCGQVACDCASPINVTVVKAGGGSIPNVTIESATVSFQNCSDEGSADAGTTGKTYCHAYAPDGKHALDIKAPGYQTKHVEVTVSDGDPGSCCRCSSSALVEVTLDPV